jgi:DNA-binding NarL/FixJ family response regulator
MTRVAIRASSRLLRAGLESLLRAYPQISILEETEDDAHSRDDAPTDLLPDVILAEGDGGEDDMFDGPESSAPVILLVRDPVSAWAAADRARVRAVLPEDATGSQIAAAIEAVAAGLSVFDPEKSPLLRTANGVLDRLPEPLTPREIEVLRAMAEGLANKEIAARLGVSENTVKFHVASVMGKLGAGSRTEAVMLGVRHGLVLI